jgi:hypothetical protein
MMRVGALLTIAFLGLPTAAVSAAGDAGAKAPDDGREAHAMTGEVPALQFGFRHDPQEFVDGNGTLEGALVRTLVLGHQQEGDADLTRQAIADIVADQGDDGSFGDGQRPTAEAICRLVEFGYAPDAPEVQRAADALVRLVQRGEAAARVFEEQDAELLPMGVVTARALCLARRTDLPELQTTLRWYADHADDWLNRGCPWGQSLIMLMLWEGREVVDVGPGLTRALTWLAESINRAGCLSYFDPWAFVKVAGIVDHPLCRRIIEKQLTLILTAQGPAGGWSMPQWWPTQQSSLNVFRALARHGLLERLRKLPPLPPGWRVVREIPAPEAGLWGLVWDGERWWTCDRQANTALAVSPQDGRVLKALKLPDGNVRGLGWADGALVLNQGDPWKKDPKRLLRLDPDTGEILQQWPLGYLEHVGGVAQVNGRLWVVDSFFGWLFSLDNAGEIVRSHVSLAGPLPVVIAPEGEAVWHVDLWVPFLIKSGLDSDGHFLDCIERPFGQAMGGVGFDGQHLWVLNSEDKRICLIERANRT